MVTHSNENGGRTVEDLLRLADRDPLVRTHLTAWRYGVFPTLEQMLVALSCELAAARSRLAEDGLHGAPPATIPFVARNDQVAAERHRCIAICREAKPHVAGCGCSECLTADAIADAIAEGHS